MIILYDKTEEAFTSLGLGVLSDAISCKVRTVLNGVIELEMNYPTTGRLYADLKVSNIIKAVTEKGGSAQLFDIETITKPINGIVTVYAAHVSARKQFIPVLPFTATGIIDAIGKIDDYAAEDNPFTFWTDKSTTANFALKNPASLGQVLGGMEGSLLDVYGGEYEFDNFTVKIWNRRGQNNGVSLRYGKNITDIEQEESIASTITGICPFWGDQDGNTVTLPETTVDSEKAANFPYKRTVVKDFSQAFETAPTVAQLRAAAEAYISANGIGVPKVSISVSYENLADYEEYADVALLEQVRLGDTVSVFFEPLEITAEARVVETRYNVLLDKYDKISIGSVKSNLSTTLNAIQTETKTEIEAQSSTLEKSFKNAIDILSGADGGNIIVRRNAVTGKPYEILAMDTDDINTAQNVVRLNSDGIGVSTHGIAGPYTIAGTGAGLVATAITAGVLNASLIKTGVLEDLAGKFSINMTTGAINMQDGTFKGVLNGSTINNGNGKFTVNSNGDVVANSFTSNNVNITGGNINMLGQSIYPTIKLASTLSPNYFTEMGPLAFVARNPDNGHEANYYGGGFSVSDYSSGQTRLYIVPEGISFYNASGTLIGAVYANASDRIARLYQHTSASYGSLSAPNMNLYKAFVLCATRGGTGYSGVVASVYIPREVALKCNSAATECFAQSGNYGATCYFDFSAGRVYGRSTNGGDNGVQIYGIK